MPQTGYGAGGTPLAFSCRRTFFFSPVFSAQHCNNPGPIENGEMEGSPPFTCAATVKYMCNEGYELHLGPEILQCQIGGQWEHVKPACIRKSKITLNIFFIILNFVCVCISINSQTAERIIFCQIAL